MMWLEGENAAVEYAFHIFSGHNWIIGSMFGKIYQNLITTWEPLGINIFNMGWFNRKYRFKSSPNFGVEQLSMNPDARWCHKKNTGISPVSSGSRQILQHLSQGQRRSYVKRVGFGFLFHLPKQMTPLKQLTTSGWCMLVITPMMWAKSPPCVTGWSLSGSERPWLYHKLDDDL